MPPSGFQEEIVAFRGACPARALPSAARGHAINFCNKLLVVHFKLVDMSGKVSSGPVLVSHLVRMTTQVLTRSTAACNEPYR